MGRLAEEATEFIPVDDRRRLGKVSQYGIRRVAMPLHVTAHPVQLPRAGVTDEGRYCHGCLDGLAHLLPIGPHLEDLDAPTVDPEAEIQAWPDMKRRTPMRHELLEVAFSALLLPLSESHRYLLHCPGLDTDLDGRRSHKTKAFR